MEHSSFYCGERNVGARKAYSLGLFELLNALGDGEVFLSAVFANNKEAASLIKLRVDADLKVVEVCHLGVCALMEADDFFDKGFVVTFEALSVFLQVQDGSALRLHLVNVQIVDAGDLVTGLSALHTFSLLNVSCLSGLLRLSELVLDAEVVVSALVLPELLKRLTFELGELE